MRKRKTFFSPVFSTSRVSCATLTSEYLPRVRCQARRFLNAVVRPKNLPAGAAVGYPGTKFTNVACLPVLKSPPGLSRTQLHRLLPVFSNSRVSCATFTSEYLRALHQINSNQFNPNQISSNQILNKLAWPPPAYRALDESVSSLASPPPFPCDFSSCLSLSSPESSETTVYEP